MNFKVKVLTLAGSLRVLSTTIEGKSMCEKLEGGVYIESRVREQRAMNADTTLFSPFSAGRDSSSEKNGKYSGLPTTANPVKMCPHMHAQRLIFKMILNLTKFTTEKTNYTVKT